MPKRAHKSGNGRAKRGAKRKETAAAATAATAAAAAAAAAAASAASGDEAEGGEGGARGSEQKGAPFVGGYRENEARHRVPHGPFSRHGARQRPQQSGPPSAGARAARARARDRDNDRREPHTRLAHVRAARAVNTNRVFFILGATSLFLSSSCCRYRRALLPPASSSRVSVLFLCASPGRYRDGPRLSR